MSSFILSRRIAFNNQLQEAIEDLQEEEVARGGRFRPGGRVDLDKLGDTVWKEQFRYVYHPFI
jgi:hypothetical protein